MLIDQIRLFIGTFDSNIIAGDMLGFFAKGQFWTYLHHLFLRIPTNSLLMGGTSKTTVL